MRKIAFTIIMIWALVANAQIDNLFTFNTSNQQIVQSAVEKGFVKVSSSYRLQDLKSKKLYGRNGKDAFGTVSSWGVKISGGYILLDEAIHPWNYDENYKKYRGKYGTIPYQIKFSFDGEDIINDSLDSKVCNNQNVLFFAEDSVKMRKQGFEVETSDGEKDGWLIWLTEDNDSTNSFLVFRKKIEFKSNTAIYDVEQPNTTKQIVAGIFVVPTYTSIGVVRFNLSGVLIDQDGKWLLAKPTIPSNCEEIHSDVKTEVSTGHEVSDSDLTPIETSKKNNKKIKRKRNE